MSSSDRFDISGKRIMVTGGAGGLGRAIAQALLESGAKVVIFGTGQRAGTAAAEFRAQGFSAFSVQGDLADPDSVSRCFFSALELLDGSVDVLFNVAGVQARHRSEEFPLSDWSKVLDVNLTAPFLLCQLAAREMIRKNSGGKIINIASMLSFFGGVTVPAYAASKGGVAQLTKALCNEWAKYGINVNAIAPGYMDTRMNTALISDPVRNDEILSRIPAGRWGTGDDIQGLAIFLASGASDYINGAIIPCDGGYLVR